MNFSRFGRLGGQSDSGCDSDGKSGDKSGNKDVEIDLSDATRGQRINTQSGYDTVTGSAFDDRIRTGKGDDSVDAGAGDDRVEAGKGDDTVLGGAGDDRIDADKGDDSVDGGDGDDCIDGGQGNDTLLGGAGDDDIEAGSGDDVVDGGAGDDRIDADSGNDLVTGGAGNDEIDLGCGDDTAQGGAGDDTISGGSGFDTVIYAGSILDFEICFTGSCADSCGRDDDRGHHHGHAGSKKDKKRGHEDPGHEGHGRGHEEHGRGHGYGHNGGYFHCGWGDRLTVTDLTGVEGTDSLDGIEQIVFGDYVLMLDGTNNIPVVSVADQTVTESGTVAFDMEVYDFDGDAVVVDSITASAGLVSYTEVTGSDDGCIPADRYTLVFDTNGEFEWLSVGETAEVTVTIVLDDGEGGLVTREVVVTVTGENDAPTLMDGAMLAEEDGPAVLLDLTALGDDIDSEDDGTTLVYTVTGAPSEGSASVVGTDLVFDPLADFQDLGVGQTRDVVVEVTATDAQGATAVAHVTVTVSGTNDAPTVSATPATGFVEALDAQNQTLSDTGVVSFDDIDSGDLIALSVASNDDMVWSGGTLKALLADTLVAGFSLGATGPMAPGSVPWTYDATAVLDFLSEGETVTWSYTITATDSAGAVATDVVQFTLTGTNDRPAITSAPVDLILTEAVDPAPLFASGQVTWDDLDLNDTHVTPVDMPQLTFRDGEGGMGPSPFGAATEAAIIDGLSFGADGSWSLDLPATLLLDQLAHGDSLTLSTLLRVVDSSGAANNTSFDQTFRIVIAGTNDAPVIFAGDTAGAVAELADGAAGENAVAHTAAGQLLYGDLDASDTHVVSVVPQDAGYLGVLEVPGGAVAMPSPVGTSGTVDWVFTVDDAVLDGLAEGQVIRQVYDVILTDPHGASATEQVVIEITGANDAPEFVSGQPGVGAVMEASSDADGVVVDAGVPVATGTLVAIDVDAGDALTWSGNAVGAYGSFAITAGGAWTYTLDNVAADNLGAGELRSESFVATVTDGTGATATQVVVVEITGANDAPDAQPLAATVYEGPLAGDPGADMVTLGAVFTDVDAPDSHVVSVDTTGTLGAVTDHGDGTFTYAANGAFEWLGVGQTATDTFAYTVDDGQGGTDTEVVTITILGLNDGPTIAATGSAGWVEDLDAMPQSLADAGVVSFDDIDAGDLLDVTYVANGDVTWSGGALPPVFAAMFEAGFSTGVTGAAAPGSVAWTYAADLPLDFLSEGETVTWSYTVTVTDSAGESASDVVAFSITGTNDAPTLSATAASGWVEAADASAQQLVDQGVLNFEDLDINDALTLAHVVAAPVWSGGTLSAAQAAALMAGFSIADTSVTGTGMTWWAYDTVLDLDFLGAGETISFEVAVTATDGSGASASDVIEFTITGTNDGPVALDTVNDGPQLVERGATEPGHDVAAGNVLTAASDADANGTLEVSGLDGQTGGSSWSAQGVYGTLYMGANGTWTYLLDDYDPDTNALAYGQVEQEVFSYTVVDDQGASDSAKLVLDILGSNDAPMALGDINTGPEVVENGSTILGNPSATGNALDNDSDPDTGDVLTVIEVNGASGNVGAPVNGVYGALVLGWDGTWVYTLDDANPDTEALAQGEVVYDSFSYLVTDTHGQTATATITIRITGSEDNRAPVAVDNTRAAVEDVVLSAMVESTDPDLPGDTLTHTVETGPSHGALTLNADGSYDYTPDADYSGTDSFTFRVTDAAGAYDIGTETIHIEAVADAPTLALNPPSTPTYAFAGTGVDTQVSLSPLAERYGTVTALSDGGYVVAWQTEGFDGFPKAMVRRYDSDGTALTPPLLVTNQNEGTANVFPVVVDGPDGGFTVVQTGLVNGATDVRYIRFDANNVQQSWVSLSTGGVYGNAELADAVTLADGRIATAFTYGSDAPDGGTGSGVYLRILNPANNAFEVATQIVPTVTASGQSFAAIEPLANGGFVVVWNGEDEPGQSLGVFGQRFDANAQPVGGDFAVNSTTAFTQAYPDVGSLSDGGFVVSWFSDSQDGSSTAIMAQRYDANGVAVGGEFLVNTTAAGAQITPTVQGLPDGGFVISWFSQTGDGDGFGVFQQLYDASGAAYGLETRVNNLTVGDQASGGYGGGNHMAVLADGTIVNVWDTNNGAGEIYTTRTIIPDSSTPEDTPIPLGLSAALVDMDGSESLSLRLEGFPAGAVFNMGAADGTGWLIPAAEALDLSVLEMTPPADWTGLIELVVTATATEGSNGDQASVTATAWFAVTPVNDDPEAAELAVTTDEDAPVTVDVLAAVTDVDGGVPALDGVGAAAHGTVVIDDNGTPGDATDDRVIYTPNADFFGADSFEYTVSDGFGGTDTGTVTVEVAPVNDAPQVVDTMALFSGATGDRAQVSGLTGFPTTAVTMSANIRIDTDNVLEHYISYAVPGSANELLLRTFGDAIGVYANNGFIGQIAAPGVRDGAVHQITVTLGGGTMAVYLDGALQGTLATASLLPMSSGGTLMLGQDQDSVGGGLDPNQSLKGAMDDVAIWNRVLTPSEVALLYLDGADRSDAGLYGYWSFNAASASFDDMSGNGRHMTTVGTLGVVEEASQALFVAEGGTVTVGGLQVSDIDGALVQVSVQTEGTSTVSFGNLGGASLDPGAATPTIVGTLSEVNAALATLQFQPGAGVARNETLTITVDDLGNSGSGGPLTDTIVVPIRIGGLEVAPVAASSSGVVTEDTVLSTFGTVYASDANGDTLSFDVVGSGTSAYGTFSIDDSGAWTYLLDNGSAAVQALNSGASVTDQFQVTVSDGRGYATQTVVSVVVNGVDDGGPNLLVDFEDRPAQTTAISGVYEGFIWQSGSQSLWTLQGTGYSGGYNAAGTGHVAYTPGASKPVVVTRSNGDDFEFFSVELTAAWDASGTATVSGYLDGVLVDSGSIGITNSGPTLFEADWGMIDELQLTSTGEHLVLDNFEFLV